MIFFGPKEIKLHVQRILENRGAQLRTARVLDLPCGNGHSLEILKQLGASVVGADLFPELNRVKDVEVVKVDLAKPLPFSNESFDFILCQEGIEHVGAQDSVFLEFSRILKRGGRLLITTPNYSNLKSRLSYLLTESEAFGRIMPPNERDSIWLNKSSSDIYFGHVFLTGFLRLRLFAKCSGFDIVKVHPSRVNYTSLLFFPFIFPFIWLASIKTFFRFQRKTKAKKLGGELFDYMISLNLLLENHLIVEFEKRRDPIEVRQQLSGLNNENMTT